MGLGPKDLAPLLRREKGMGLDILGVKHAVDDVTTQTVPEVVKALNQLMDRVEKLVDKLDGLSIVVVMGGRGNEPKN